MINSFVLLFIKMYCTKNAELSKQGLKLKVVVALDLNGLVQRVKFADLDGVPDRDEERSQMKKIVDHQ